MRARWHSWSFSPRSASARRLSRSLADMNLVFGQAADDMTTCMVMLLMQEFPLLKALNLSENEIDADAKAAISTAAPATLELTF